MDLGPRQTAAVRAVIEAGSFEQAAVRLNLTSSAVSQRVRALETRLGNPLIVRTRTHGARTAGWQAETQTRGLIADQWRIGGSEPLLAVAGLLVAFAGLALTFADGAGAVACDAGGFAALVFAATFTACG